MGKHKQNLPSPEAGVICVFRQREEGVGHKHLSENSEDPLRALGLRQPGKHPGVNAHSSGRGPYPEQNGHGFLRWAGMVCGEGTGAGNFQINQKRSSEFTVQKILGSCLCG